MIRSAGPFDPPAMAAIHAAAFPAGEAWSATIFAGHLSMPGVFGFLTEEGGLILARAAADEAEILTLAVVPEARRAGVGRALLERARSAAAAAGAEAMFLEVSAGNLAARGLYDAAGFETVGRRRRYYPDGSDALVMRVSLVARGASPPCALE